MDNTPNNRFIPDTMIEHYRQSLAKPLYQPGRPRNFGLDDSDEEYYNEPSYLSKISDEINRRNQERRLWQLRKEFASSSKYLPTEDEWNKKHPNHPLDEDESVSTYLKRLKSDGTFEGYKN